jgi:hypothetical protein
VTRGFITLSRAATAIGYAMLAWFWWRDGLTSGQIWWLTLIGLLCLSYILAADWIAGGGTSQDRRSDGQGPWR